MSDAFDRRSAPVVQSPKRHWIDGQDCPEWGVLPDGRRTRIADDERLPSLFMVWQADACSHDETVIVHREDSLGRSQFYMHCEHCGLKLSSAIAHGKVGEVSSLTEDDMRQREGAYTGERKARLDKIADDAAVRCDEPNRESYSDYLRSDAWRRRRAKIMQRAAGVCEGCLTHPAEEVHHLTYAHLGAEFAWELRAVCGACHRRLHDRG